VFPAGDIRGSESAALWGVVGIRQQQTDGRTAAKSRYGF